MTDRPQVNIRSRHAWRARPPKRRHYIKTPTAELWLHHFASEHHGDQGMRDIQSFHMDKKGWSDIAYSFCVDDDGTIYEGRGVGVAGGHTEGRNSISHAICLMGNFHVRQVPKRALQSVAALAAHGIEQGWWKGWTGGHRQAPGASTACPGDHAIRAWRDLTALTELYRTGTPAPQQEPPKPQEDDMALIVRGDKTPHWWITDGLHKDYIETTDIAAVFVFTGLAKWNDGHPHVLAQNIVDSIPTVAKPTTAEQIKAALSGLGDVALSDAQVASIIEAIPPKVVAQLGEKLRG